jgi:AcrR family transcriptional regulator
MTVSQHAYDADRMQEQPPPMTKHLTLKPIRSTPDRRMSEIIAAARALLAEKGSENFVTTEVASRCGVSEATIFRYFPTKRDLLLKVTELWFAEILAEEPQGAPHPGTFDRLRQVIWRSLSIVRREPALTRYILMELRSDPTYRSMPVYELNRRFTSSVTSVVQEAVAAGEFRADVPAKLVRDMIFGCIEHRTWAYLRGEGDFSVDATADAIAQVIFRGMTIRPQRDDDGLASSIAVLEHTIESLQREIRLLKDRRSAST